MITLAEFQEEMAQQGMMNCKFVCSVCGNVASPADFAGLDVDPSRAPQECIGRHSVRRIGSNRPCNFATYGLIPGPREVQMPGGKVITVFRFAEETDV